MLHSVCLTGSNQCLHQKIQLHPIHRISGARLLFAFVSYQTLFHCFLPAIANKRQRGTSKVKPQLRPRLCWVITERAREIKGGACSPCTTSSSRPRGTGQGRRQQGPQGHPGASVGEGSSARARPVPAVSPSAARAPQHRGCAGPAVANRRVCGCAAVLVPLLPLDTAALHSSSGWGGKAARLDQLTQAPCTAIRSFNLKITQVMFYPKLGHIIQ